MRIMLTSLGEQGLIGATLHGELGTIIAGPAGTTRKIEADIPPLEVTASVAAEARKPIQTGGLHRMVTVGSGQAPDNGQGGPSR